MAIPMNLYLDDLRKAPEGWTLVRNYRDCIFALGTQNWETVSLDYSLGERWTGLDVLQWIVRNGRYPDRINIHSGDMYGRSAMADYIRTNFPLGYPFTMKCILG